MTAIRHSSTPPAAMTPISATPRNSLKAVHPKAAAVVTAPVISPGPTSRKVRPIASGRSAHSGSMTRSRVTMCSAKSTPSPMRMAEKTIERSCRWPIEMTTHPKLHAMPTTSEVAAMSGNRMRRNTPMSMMVIRPKATIEAMVESRVAWSVSSDSMAGMPVTPHGMSPKPFSFIHSAAELRSVASVSAMPAMEPVVGSDRDTSTVRMRPLAVASACQ